MGLDGFNDFIGARLTYYGMLDDVVERYPFSNDGGWQDVERDLVLNAIYGKPILVNDGYLTANPLVHSQLLDLSNSCVGNLLIHRFGRVFSRDQSTKDNFNLAKGIEDAARNKIATHAAMVNGPSWNRTKESLEALSKVLKDDAILWPKSKNTSAILHHLVDEAIGGSRRFLEHDEDKGVFAEIFHQVSGADPQFNSLRGEFEIACLRHFEKKPISPLDPELKKLNSYGQVQRLMKPMNEFYHTAMAIAAQVSADDGLINKHHLVKSNTIGLVTSTTLALPQYLDGFQNNDESDGWLAQFKPASLKEIDRMILTLGRIRFRSFEFI